VWIVYEIVEKNLVEDDLGVLVIVGIYICGVVFVCCLYVLVGELSGVGILFGDFDIFFYCDDFFGCELGV